MTERKHHMFFELATEHGTLAGSFTFSAEIMAYNLLGFRAMTGHLLDEEKPCHLLVDDQGVGGATLGEQLAALERMFPVSAPSAGLHTMLIRRQVAGRPRRQAPDALAVIAAGHEPHCECRVCAGGGA